MKKEIWYGNMINLSGLYSLTPIKCYGSINLDGAWDRYGNFSTPEKEGIVECDGCTVISSKNRNKVKYWTEGVISAMSMLNQWSNLKEGEEE